MLNSTPGLSTSSASAAEGELTTGGTNVSSLLSLQDGGFRFAPVFPGGTSSIGTTQSTDARASQTAEGGNQMMLWFVLAAIGGLILWGKK